MSDFQGNNPYIISKTFGNIIKSKFIFFEVLTSINVFEQSRNVHKRSKKLINVQRRS